MINFCKENPFFEVPCPKCRKTHKFKSKEVFAKDVFCFECQGAKVEFLSKQVSDEMKNKLKKLGIKF